MDLFHINKVAWGRVRGVASAILVKNKKNHEPNSPGAMFFSFVLCKVPYINELTVVLKILLDLTAFVVFLLMQLFAWVLAAK